jgi:arginyl-tRNA synthetase
MENSGTTLQDELERRLTAALAKVLPDAVAAAGLSASTDLRFGDYQSNAAMVQAKAQRSNPRALAEQLVAALEVDDVATVEIAGPGFINFRIKPGAWAKRVEALLADPRLGVPQTGGGREVVIDFSAPNVAKPMHVGHIRSTILGDALARIARFLGYKVITDNHIGDWGTQFGMILHGWKTILDQARLKEDPIGELVGVYKRINAACKEDATVLQACKAELVKLQAGDAANLAIWRECIELSKSGLERIYGLLEVRFDYWLGESFYNERLPSLVEELVAKGLARESEGAICVFSSGAREPGEDPFKVFRDGEWQDNPAIIRKEDGGFLYATTDLATLEHRVNAWQAKHVWYVVGAPQQLHFRQIFDAAGRWGLTADFQHVAFGSILGDDRKLMKTRSGENVQLADVLSEAVERARKVIEEKNPSLDAAEREEVAEIVGLGAVKFAELSQHRLTDYVFSWDRMLALQGDTAPYLQYSYVRTRSIFRKLDSEVALDGPLEIAAEGEIHLARMLARFGEVVPAVLDDFRPNILANYLLELAKAFHSFFEACPVLKAEGETRRSRLALCELTSRVLERGLGLLGIRVPQRM